MKKLHVIILLSLFTFKSYGQFSKGDQFMGGQLTFSSTTNSNTSGLSLSKLLSIGISPLAGAFVNEHLALGGHIGYTYLKNNYYLNDILLNAGQVEQIENKFTIGFMARRYYTISDKFLFALHGFLDYATSSSSREINSDITKEHSNSASITLSPAFHFFPSSQWGFEGSIGSLSYEYIKNSDETHTNKLGFSYGSIALGFSYYFRKAK